MKLQSFRSRGFGCLPNGYEFEFAPEGLTLILGNNEMGKSTLVQGILAALFGEPQSSKRKGNTVFNDRETFIKSYSPWDMPQQGPRLTLTLQNNQGRSMIIERDFGSSSSKTKQSVKVYDAYSRTDLTRDFETEQRKNSIGETFTGMSRGCFEKSALLLQNNIQVFDSDPDLIHTIEKIIVSSETGTSAPKALEALENAEYQNNPLNPASKTPVTLKFILSKIKEQLEALAIKESTLLSEYQKYQTAFKEADTLSDELAEKQASVDVARTRLGLAEYLEAQAQLEQQHQLKVRLEAIQLQLEPLRLYEHFPAESQRDLEKAYDHLTFLQQECEKSEALCIAAQKAYTEKENTLKAYPWDFETLPYAEIQTLIRSLEEAKNQYQSALNEYQAEQRRLDVQGHDCLRFEKLLKKFEALPADKLPTLYQLLQQQESLNQELSILLSAEKRHEIQTKEQATLHRKRQLTGIITLSVGAFILGLSFLPFSAASWLKILGGLTIIAGVVSLIHAGNVSANQFLKTEQQNRNQNLARLKENLDNLKAEYEHLIVTLQQQFPWITESDFAGEMRWFFENRQVLFNRFASAIEKLKLRQEDMETTCKMLAKSLQMSLPEEMVVSESLLNPQIESFRRFETAYTECQLAGQQRKQHSEKLTTETLNCQSAQEKLAELLANCGMADYTDLEAGMLLFNQGLASHQQFTRLQKEFTETTQGLLTPETITVLEAQKERTLKFASTSSPTDLRIIPEERSHLQNLQAEVETLKERLEILNRSITDKRDHYNKEYPALKMEQAELTDLFTRYTQFQQALAMARESLKEVSEKEYKQWSQRLNERVNTYLSRFHSPYHDLHFDTQLAFSFKDDADKRYDPTGTFQSLSCGARDQIYLAVRLAITDYLSQSCGHLPLILDDPFVNFDDERFMHAMETLAQAGAMGQQVLLFTCHKQRHQQLFEALSPHFPSSFFMKNIEKIKQNVVLIGES